MAETANNTISTAAENENRVRRKLIGFFLFPIALFPFLALISYRWQAMEALNIPPEETSNLIGVIGDTFAYIGYQVIGLAIWAVAPLTLFLGLLLVMGKAFRPSRRFLSFLLFMFATTCLLQLLGKSASISSILNDLNLGSNAGGALGYLVMDSGLSRLVSPFGASILMATLMIFALISMIGFKTILVGLGNFIGGKPLSPEEIEAKEAKKREAEERMRAIQAAKEAARAAKEAEKRRIAEERANAKAAKEAEKDAARAAIEAAREAARAAKEAERRGAPAHVAAADHDTVASGLTHHCKCAFS